jgi:alcohol dehydrogenase
MKPFNIYNGGVKLFFGVNRLDEVKPLLRGFRKLLIVTGRRSAKVSGALDDIVNLLNSLGIGYEQYDRVKPNPDKYVVEEIAEVYRSGGFDGFVAIGGGSVIDSAKAARVVVSGGGSIEDYLYHRRRIPEKQPFLLAVNLTHGTGTEIDRYSVVSIPEKREKIGFGAGYPTASIDDPRYTLTLPRNQTIYTSIDAFAHSVESSTSILASPYTELLSSEAIRLIVEYLPKTLSDPKNIEYRYWLLYASMIAGISIDHGVTHLGHGLEHVLSGINPSLPHGAGLAILYKSLIKIFYQHNPETMAKLLKPLDPGLRPILDDSVKAQKAYNRFLERIGFDESLSSYGFGRDDIGEIVKLYMDYPIYRRYRRLSPFKITREMVRNIIDEVL